MRLPEQKNTDIGSEPAAHVGEQEVDQIEAVAEGHETCSRGPRGQGPLERRGEAALATLPAEDRTAVSAR